MVFELSENRVAEFLVEPERLKRERIEPHAGTPALLRNFFRLAHELGAHAGGPKMFRHKEQFDEKPFVGGSPPGAADGGALLVLQEESEQAIVGVGRVLEVELAKCIQDGF